MLDKLIIWIIEGHKRFKTGESDEEEQIIISINPNLNSKSDLEEEKERVEKPFSYFEDCYDFDPDNDGFSIDIELANKLHKRLNMLYYLRK